MVQFSYISKREKENNVELFNYLHIVMHCIFRHMYKDPALNRRYWDLACDIAVEYMIAELELKSVSAEPEKNRQDL